MTFKPWDFTYTPPKTVPDQAPPAAAAIEGTTPSQGSANQTASPAATNAGQLISHINDLLATSSYLQTSIVQRYANYGVTFDPKVDSQLTTALQNIYQSPVTTVTIPMYSRLLDAELAAMQLEIELGQDSSKEPNPLVVSDYMYATNQMDKALLAQGTYQASLPTLLRSLKGDDLMLQNWSRGLQDYPAFKTPNQVLIGSINANGPGQSVLNDVAGTDVSNPLFNFFFNYTAKMSAAYGSLYQALSTVGHIEAGVENVLESFVLVPVQEVIRVVGLFQAAKELFHKDALQGLAESMSSFIYARVAAEVGLMTFLVDRVVHLAVDPLKNSITAIGGMIARFNNLANQIGTAQAGLKGLSTTNPCNCQQVHNQSSKQISIPGLNGSDGLSTAMASFGQHLSWATRLVDNHRAQVTESLYKAANRRNVDSCHTLDVMCSLRALDTLLNIGRGFVTETQSGTSFTTASTTQKSEAYGRILSSLRSTTGSSYVIQNGNVVAVPPDMPALTDPVQRSLVRGGLDLISPTDLQTIKGT